MKKALVIILITLSSNVFAEGTRPNPGLWEYKVVKQVVDGQDMQAQMAAAEAQMKQAMANLTPEQRKQMEAMTRGQGASAGAMSFCISKEMAARDKPVLGPQSHCETVKSSRSGNKVSYEIKCSNKGQTTSGKGETTVGSDLMKTVMDINTSDAHGSHAIHSESQMKFIGSDCRGIKPAN